MTRNDYIELIQILMAMEYDLKHFPIPKNVGPYELLKLTNTVKGLKDNVKFVKDAMHQEIENYV